MLRSVALVAKEAHRERGQSGAPEGAEVRPTLVTHLAESGDVEAWGVTAVAAVELRDRLVQGAVR
jgi:hypothetical protein